MTTDGKQAAPERPVIARFSDYRAFVRDMVEYLRATKSQFSYRWFARVAGFNSPSFLKLVADGKRNLSQDSIDRFAKGLDLSAKERDIFETLVLLDQAKSDEARNRYFGRLQTLSVHDPVGRLQADQYEAYSRWYAFVIRELAAFTDFIPDPEAIARRLRPRVRPLVVRRALELLERLGLIVADAEGIPRPAEPVLSSGPAVRSLAVRNFHRKMLELASRALDKVSPTERNITSVTVPLDKQEYERVCAKLSELRAEVLQLSQQGSDVGTAPGKEVYQLCLALFPVTQRRD